ncbi:hypothetical protein BDV96DRAFT_579741 [Lophiotrema nucula]|uniref:Uncharacterized protein n=1 Tax=Lophiotrema nucula TaxID=690887 RepID=A0A6A5Z265_9PLEO|nr:hypothetical protein BDV96DRAFT_579741 [Lophiotrema nucula]
MSQPESFRKESGLEQNDEEPLEGSSVDEDSDDDVDSDQELMDIMTLLRARTKRVLKRKEEYARHIERLEKRMNALERQCDEMRNLVTGLPQGIPKPSLGGATAGKLEPDTTLPPASFRVDPAAQTHGRFQEVSPTLGHHFPGQFKGLSVHAIDIEIPELSIVDVNALSRNYNSPPDLIKMKTKAIELLKGHSTPKRVRINSVLLQTLLNKVLGLGTRSQHFSSTDGITMVQPFKSFLQLEEHLFKLSTDFVDEMPRFQALEISGRDRSIVSVVTRQMSPLNEGAWCAYLMAENLYCCSDCAERLQQECPSIEIATQVLKTLETLINDYIKPPLRGLRDRSRQKIRFENLWYLYQPGDLVINRPQKHDYYAKAFRIITSHGGQITSPDSSSSTSTAFSNAMNNNATRTSPMSPLFIEAYFYDFDGSHLIPIVHQFVITPYDEEMDIADLEVFPAEYARPQTRQQLIERGEKFVRLCYSFEGTYLDYKGWKLEPSGQVEVAMVVSSGQQIEERVVVDPRTFLKWNSQLKPSSNQGQKLALGGIDRVNSQYNTLDIVRRRLEAMGKDATADDHALCHFRLYAFVMRTRTWIHVHVKHLVEIPANPAINGLENLILPSGHKKLLLSQIDNYPERKTSSLAFSDKGLGTVSPSTRTLLILLYGATGTGKSYTAETIAEKLRRPLYTLTCGSLGTTAQSIESSLAKHFEVARQWGSVVLLQHAEVLFYIQAHEHALQHALHGNLSPLFLESLSFYPGLLFVSMSKISNVDQAIKATARISLYYPPFDLTTTTKVWEAFVNQMQEIDRPWDMHWFSFRYNTAEFAKNLYHKGILLDGRQIQHLFQAALSLADHEDRDTTRLQIRHLELCLKAMIIPKQKKLSQDVRNRDGSSLE